MAINALPGDLLRQEFQGHEVVQPRVFRFVHHTHPATAQLLYDPVMRDGLADQLPNMLWREQGQVNEGVDVGGLPKGPWRSPSHSKPRIAGSSKISL